MDFGPGSNPAATVTVTIVTAAKHRPYWGQMRGGVIVRRVNCGCERCCLRYLQ